MPKKRKASVDGEPTVRRYAHEHTNVAPTGLGSKLSAAPGRLAKGPLEELCCSQPVARWAPPAAARSSCCSSPAAAVELELQRAAALDTLRRKLASLCAQAGLRNVPLLAFERWRFAAKWLEDEPAASGKAKGSSSSSSSSKADPVLPFGAAAAAAEPGLTNDLVRAGLTAEAAAAVAVQLAQASATAAAGVSKRRHQLASGRPASCPELVVEFHRHSIDLACGSCFAKVSRGAYGKLARLYRQHWLTNNTQAAAAAAAADDDDGAATLGLPLEQAAAAAAALPAAAAPPTARRGAEPAADENSDGDADDGDEGAAPAGSTVFAEAAIAEHQHQQQQAGAARAGFHQRLLALLLRYKSIQGPGFQAAAGPPVFQLLRTGLSCGFELFASPLNCHFQRFCSAFPDVDAPFGSSGSFFRLQLKHGSYEANPPFVPAMLTATAHRVLQLLTAAEAAGGALSFAVIMPGWQEVEGWRLLNSSSFLRQSLLVAAADHGYCDGASHQRRDLYRSSPFDSGLLFLQTTAAAAKWPVREQLLQQLRAAMAACCPSAAAAERQRKQRGLRDLELQGVGVPVERRLPAAAGGTAAAEEEAATALAEGAAGKPNKKRKKRQKSKQQHAQDGQ